MTANDIMEADAKRDRQELRRIQDLLNVARWESAELEKKRNALIRESDLAPAEVVEVTTLTKARVSQIRAN